MTKEEIKKIIDNTKVYVNGKSKEIQEKLFSFGYRWPDGNYTEVCNEDDPFLLIYDDGYISNANDMCYFTEHENREISADEILSIEVTEPSYRPFKDKDECLDEPSSGRLEDGIYIIDCKGHADRYVGEDTEIINDTAYIGIVQGSHSVAISLHDVSMDEVTLTKKVYKEDNGGYIDRYMDAVQDWDGKGNTERLKQIGLNPAIQLKDGEYIPTLAELYLICLNQKAINAAMRFVGGQELKGWYWSSTECSADSAWLLSLFDGFAGILAKAEYVLRVRPVSAF